MSRLFEPVRIGPVTLRNRTIRAAAFEGMAPGHLASPALVAYHRSVAAGGVGMTTVAYAAVERSGLAFPHQLWLRRQAVAGLRTLTEAVHAEGAAASIQIGHCGNMAADASVAGGRAIAPSARFNLFGPTWPRAMDEDDIRRVTKSFGDAVRVARDAGFDAVEVHAGHGYLISQFLSPWTNRRTDAYGGSLDRRMRFLREVVAEVRAAAHDLAVVVKMNLRDGFDGGQDLDDAVAIARALEQGGVDALVLSGGFVSRTPMYVLRGAMPTAVMSRFVGKWWLALGLRLLGQRIVAPVPYADHYFLDDAVVVRAEVKMPLVYVGGVASGEAAATVLSKGFDAIAMARALIREPDFVNRLAAEEHAQMRCDHCNYCAARIYTSNMACHLVEPPPEELRRLLPGPA